MTPNELLQQAEKQIAAGCSKMTLVFSKGTSGVCLLGRRGPRGELVCENRSGERVLMFDVHKVRDFVSRELAKAAAT